MEETVILRDVVNHETIEMKLNLDSCLEELDLSSKISDFERGEVFFYHEGVLLSEDISLRCQGVKKDDFLLIDHEDRMERYLGGDLTKDCERVYDAINKLDEVTDTTELELARYERKDDEKVEIIFSDGSSEIQLMESLDQIEDNLTSS